MDAFEDELISTGYTPDTPVVASIALGYKEGQRNIGMAFLDRIHREIRIAMFIDDDLYRNVECMFVQLGIKECSVSKVCFQVGYKIFAFEGRCFDRHRKIESDGSVLSSGDSRKAKDDLL